DAAAKAVQKTPNRVSLESIVDKIEHEEYVHPAKHGHVTVCFLTMDNGYLVTGISAPADPGNFDQALGEKFSREDAIRQVWKLEGYLLCEKLSTSKVQRGTVDKDLADQTARHAAEDRELSKLQAGAPSPIDGKR